MPTANGDPNALCTLAALLGRPGDDALDAVRDPLPAAPWLAEAIAQLEQTPSEHWQGEHTRLFVSGWPKTPCPPFQSAYRQGQMGGTSAGDLSDLYRRAGLQASEAPADYLGTLLECAAWLAHTKERADLLYELENEHRRLWVPRFARDLRESSRLILYRVLGGQIARHLPSEKLRE
jgi:TorA maturation chaperone TorD